VVIGLVQKELVNAAKKRLNYISFQSGINLLSGCHTGMASFGTFSASLRTSLAVFHMAVLFTFFGAGIADLCTFIKQVLCMFRTPGYIRSRKHADFGAVNVKLNAS
jgi:hypothetical protein